MTEGSNSGIHQALARKWRPARFAEVVGQQHVLTPLVNSLRLGKLHHAYLLTGTRGVGKTSLARILAKAICCQQRQGSEPCGECAICKQIAQGRCIDLIEVDAASRSKVEETRELLENLHYAPASGAHRVYIIDEVHMFSRHSFNSLLKVLEEPPGHITFILATTEYRKIPSTILSRCLQFHLRHLSTGQINAHLAHILKQESIKAEDAALADIAKAARGSMRDALSLLDQAISAGEGAVSEEATRAMLGAASIDQAYALTELLMAGDIGAIIDSIDRFAEQAIDCSELLDEVIALLQSLALLKSHPALAESESFRAQAGERDLAKLADKATVRNIHLYEHIALDGRSRLHLNPSGERALKMCFARMLVFADSAETGAGQKGAATEGGASASAAPAAATPAPSASAEAPRRRPERREEHTAPPPPPSAPKPRKAEAGSGAPRGKVDLLASHAGWRKKDVSEAMRLWREVVSALASSKEIPPYGSNPLRRHSELLSEEGQWRLRFLKQEFADKDSVKARDIAVAALKDRLDGAEVTVEGCDDIGNSIRAIEKDEWSANLDKFGQLACVKFLAHDLKARLVDFEFTGPEDKQ